MEHIKITDADIERIKNGGPAPFGIKELAKSAGVSVQEYAKAHGISPRTAEGWLYGRPCHAFIIAALYFWDKSAGIHKTNANTNKAKILQKIANTPCNNAKCEYNNN